MLCFHISTENKKPIATDEQNNNVVNNSSLNFVCIFVNIIDIIDSDKIITIVLMQSFLNSFVFK